MLGKRFLNKSIDSSVNVFFSFLTNTVFLKKNYTWQRLTIPFSVFYFCNPVFKQSSFINFKIFNNKSLFWNVFYKFITFDNNSKFGFFSELELVGLGFRIKKITSRIYRFFWGHANFVYLFVPSEVFIEYSADERFIFFFSINLSLMNNIITHLVLLKKLSSYRVTGFIKPGRIIRLNSGKQR